MYAMFAIALCKLYLSKSSDNKNKNKIKDI